MKAVLQRVNFCELHVGGDKISSIGPGLLILLGIHEKDNETSVENLVSKVLKMRIFSDDNGKMNKSVLDIMGEVMVVSQFTLYADTKKGNRPSFIEAARPEKAIPLYELFKKECSQQLGKEVASGIFGADMKITFLNDGPVTIIVEDKG